MAGITGIEHKTDQSLLEAYERYETPKFSIWQGKRLCVVYEGEDLAEGSQVLQQFCQQILQSGTSAVYLLKVHPDKVKEITTNSESKGSTSFQLGSYNLGGGGVNIINPAGPGAANTGRDVWARLEKLEQDNVKLREDLHKEQLNQLRAEFEQKISGLSKKEKKDKKNWWEHLDDILTNHKDTIKEAVSGLKDIGYDIFATKKNYIVDNQGGGQVAGTQAANNNQVAEDLKYSFTPEGALINPLLSAAQLQLKKKEQSQIMTECIKALSEDQQNDAQDEMLAIISKRIGNDTLTRMLLVVACLDNDDMNKLLSNLD